MSADELLEIVKQMVWKSQCIDSYQILANLVAMGWKYDNKKFIYLLGDLRRDEGTLSLSDVDMFIQCKPLTLDALVLDYGMKRNCYNCDFLQNATRNYTIQKLFDKENKSYDDRDKDKVYCALNPILKIRLAMSYIPDKCPYNEAYKKMLAEQEKAKEGKEDENN